MQTKKNYILILVDCLRKDYLSCYNQQLPYTTPHIDDLAEQGCYINRLVSQSSWTKPVIVSLFCGIFPFNHRVYGSYEKMMSMPTIAGYFKEAGYTTKAFSANPYITKDAGFDCGFDLFWLSESINGHILCERVIEEFRDSFRPFFYYIHFMDTHAPYYPKEGFKQLAARYNLKGGEKVVLNEDARKKLIELYQEAVKKTDSLIGEIMQHVNLKNTNVIVLSDHGDEFFDHGGLFHAAGKLYSENIEVPLVFAGPDFTCSNKTSSLVNIVDLPPTLLESAMIEYDPSQFDGKSFYRELMEDREITHTAFSEVFAHSFNKSSEALIKDNFKLIRHNREKTLALYRNVFKSLYRSMITLDIAKILDMVKKAFHFLQRMFLLADRNRKPVELYDLTNDPEELHNIADEFPEKVWELAAEIEKLKEKTKTRHIGKVDHIDMDNEVKKKLEDLGYM